VGPATVLNYSSPIYAAAFGAWFLGERVSLRTGVGILLATVGVVLVTWTTLDPTQPLTLGLGAWAGVVSALFGGAAQTVIRSLRRDTDAGSVFFSFCLFGLLWALPFAVADWRPLSSGLLLPALVMGLFSTGAQLLFTYAFAYTSAAAGSATTQLTPAFTWLLGVGLLGDSVHPLALAGSLLCVGGVLWGSSWPRARGRVALLAAAQAHPLGVVGSETSVAGRK
jgi:drug/metabolite transporter (DMT)-like permease